ncbi:hypothetical protein GBA65_21875 (plasmid) [Rubrobacter marinus]|uniref:JAB domain-containing protein n=1 Tax=Rubrobacter marinus TaxID=2653852 RepID=A0A6G8Q3Q1_9ACTN|nr:Mov34/MPN/PAD-1 family protein [Rubrobacter marinus]QIN81086.1 hypothetical protein GBA65_21875 [Rubrobacter marinus]
MSEQDKDQGTAQGAPQGTMEPEALFDMTPKKPEPEKKQPEKKQPEKGKGAAAGKSASKATSASPTKYAEGTEVRYQRHTLTLPKEMTAKEVLDWMSEDDFPELKYEETELRYDKEKNRLVPVRKAQKKGAVGPRSALSVLLEAPDEDAGPYPPVFRILGLDGVYEVRSSPLGSYCARVEGGASLTEGFFPTVPPCPAGHLKRIVEIFKERPDKEALVIVVYDSEEGEYHLVWQGDVADRGRVEYTPLPDDERYLVYAEIHSHHSMSPFFSRDDDASEKKLGVYGVVGHVDRERPVGVFRYPCGRLDSGETRFLPLRAEEIFTPAPAVWSIIDQPYA